MNTIISYKVTSLVTTQNFIQLNFFTIHTEKQNEIKWSNIRILIDFNIFIFSLQF